MTTLAADLLRDVDASVAPLYEGYPMVASDIVYEGAAVSLDSSGNARPATVADANFAGFATKKADNSGGAAGAIRVQVRTRAKVKLTVVGVTAASDVGSKVYYLDDNSFTLTPTSAVLFGKVARWITGTTCMVFCENSAYDVAT